LISRYRLVTYNWVGVRDVAPHPSRIRLIAGTYRSVTIESQSEWKWCTTWPESPNTPWRLCPTSHPWIWLSAFWGVLPHKFWLRLSKKHSDFRSLRIRKSIGCDRLVPCPWDFSSPIVWNRASCVTVALNHARRQVVFIRRTGKVIIEVHY